MVSKFRMPHQIISDRDARWKGNFWEEICWLMGSRWSLTTAYHPQADGQTEVLNQSLEIGIHAYISPDRDNWVTLLDALALSYNSSPHTVTGFSPAYLLRGYESITTSSIGNLHRSIPRRENSKNKFAEHEALNEKALHMVQGFKAEH
jgi:hypothetical protein